VAVTLDATYIRPMYHHNPMEPHTMIAVWGDDGLTLYVSRPGGRWIRTVVASVFGLDPQRVRHGCQPGTEGRVGSLVERILAVNGAVVYALVGALVFSEDALFVGFVLPGETAAVLGGVDASRGHIRLWLIILVVVAAAARVPPRSAGHESPAVVRRPACRQAPGAAAALVLHPRTAPAWRIPLRRPCRHG
jgi:hypothetical protein